MKAFTALLALGIYINATGQNYSRAIARQDSLFIYQIYRDEIAFLDSAAQNSNPQSWYQRSDLDDSLTNCAKLRLKKWNHTTYEAIDEKDLEGYGTAYLFPSPGEQKARYSIIDRQIKFTTRKDGKTETPYVERIYFSNQGEVLNVVRLDPVTVDWDESRILASDLEPR
jgi:hypothetical protein